MNSSKKITVTVEQLTAAFDEWDRFAAEDPSHFDEWDGEIAANGNSSTAAWFVERLIANGAETS